VTIPVNDSDRVPDLLLEQYRLGELSPDATARLERRLAEDADLRARLDALDRSDEAIRRQYPPEWLAGQIRLRAGAAAPASRPPARASWRRWAVPAAVAATALVAMVLMPSPVRPPDEIERIKGSGAGLVLHRRTAEGSEPLSEGAVVGRGDLVRVGYQAAGRPYGLILSIDGRGAVTRHLPAEGRSAASLERGNPVLLDYAYELDDAPRWEAFYFVTSDEPFDVEPVLAAAREAASHATGASPPTIALRSGLDQSVFMLRKKDTP